MDVYLIRHTEVAVGRHIAYGQSDVGLADTYDEQRDRLKAHLPGDPAAIFSSPLSRCRRLAEDLAMAFLHRNPLEIAPGESLPGESLPNGGVPSSTTLADAAQPGVQFDDRLKELFFGDWEMKPWADIDRPALDSWMADFVTIRTPNGENFSDVFDRVQAFWQEQILPHSQTQSQQPVFIISHGGIIRALLCLFMGLSLQNAYRINLDYGAVTKLTITESSYTIQYINR